MKRILSFVLILVTVFLACGCTSTTPTTDTTQNQETKAPSTPVTKPATSTSDSDTTAVDPPLPKEERYTFLCCGDNIGHESVFTDAKKRATATSYEYNFLPMYDGVRDLFDSADIRFINQETVTAGASFGYHGYPNFNSPQDMGKTLVDLGFDIVNIASNHMLDMRAAGLASTIDFWKTQDVTMIGGYENRQDYDTVRIFEYNGIKIALLSYTYGTNGVTLNAGSDLVIPYINETDIRRQVTAAKEQADLVFVSMHWGTDSSLTVDNSQKKYANLLAELEVDVVIGHHSHTLQDMEWKTSASGHRTLVIYSLGNLLHSMYYDTAYTVNYSFLVGGVATFEIVRSAAGVLSIENPYYHPTVCHYTKDPSGAFHAANFCVYELKDYTQELCSTHGALVQHKFKLDDLYAYVRKQVSPEFLPEIYR